MNAVRVFAFWFFLVGILGTCQTSQNELKFRIRIPKEVAAQAADRLAGNAQAPPPVLMLQGVEDPANQGVTIEVFAEPQPGEEGTSTPVLAVAGLVGEPNAAPGSSPGKINIPVALNDEGVKLLAGKSEITMILKIKVEGSLRPGFKIDHVSFQRPK